MINCCKNYRETDNIEFFVKFLLKSILTLKKTKELETRKLKFKEV